MRRTHLALAAALFAGPSVCGCSHTDHSEPAAEAPSAVSASLHDVRVTEATARQWPRIVRTQGSLIGDEHTIIGAKVSGRIKEVRVDLGSAVKKGDKLASLDLQDFELQVQRAEAELAQACAVVGLQPGESGENLDPSQTPAAVMEKALLEEAQDNLLRGRQLIKSDSISQVELQRQIAAERVARARYELALNTVRENMALIEVRRAELALTRQALADVIVVAPSDGVVHQRHVAVGAYVQVGEAVVTLVRTDPLRFHGGVPERKAMDVQIGQEVRILIEGETQPVVTRIARISPTLDPASRSLAIEADLPNPDSRWRAGLFAEAEILVDSQEQVLAVPASAVVDFAGVQKVWLVQDGEARQQRVETGRHDAEFVEVLTGLEAGQCVIADHRHGTAGKVQGAIEPADLK